MKDKEKRIEFKVIDNNTGKEADIGKIALKEDWAKGLMYCDMQGFAILDDGNLVLLDECGKFEYCPSERFSIKFENSVVLSREEQEKILTATESRINKLKEQIKQARKETAKEILKDFKLRAREYQNKDTVIDDYGERPMTNNEKLNYLYTYLCDKYKIEIKE